MARVRVGAQDVPAWQERGKFGGPDMGRATVVKHRGSSEVAFGDKSTQVKHPDVFPAGIGTDQPPAQKQILG